MSAVLFQNMPPLSPEEYAALEKSIREHGVQVPILVDENGIVIDGHHRKAIAEELGIKCPRKLVFDLSDTEKRTLALTLNVDRRHLSREQKRSIIAASLKSDPQLTDREHARRTGSSPTTVGTVRGNLESLGEVSKLDTRIDSRGYQQPAAKSATPEPAGSTIATPDGVIIAENRHVNIHTGEIIEPRTITGMDGKTYQQPQPTERTERRKPLTDQFFETVYDTRKLVERLQRLTEDDRFNQNKNQVALRHKNDLIQISNALNSVINTL